MGTDEMFKLGEAVFLEGIKKLKSYKLNEDQFVHQRSKLIIKKRLAVVEFTNGLELILKAILEKEGYCIYQIKGDKGEVLKLEDKIKDSINEERTIDLSQVVAFFKRQHSNLPFNGVDELRKLRNQIVHKGTGIGEKKRAYFINAVDCLIGIYPIYNLNHKTFLKKIRGAKSKF